MGQVTDHQIRTVFLDHAKGSLGMQTVSSGFKIDHFDGDNFAGAKFRIISNPVRCTHGAACIALHPLCNRQNLSPRSPF